MTMNCRAFEESLEALIAVELPPGVRGAAEEHAASCKRCGSLLAVVRGERDALDSLDASERERFVDSLLENTVGSPCDRARQQLCAWVDGELRAPDAELVALHVDHCSTCGRLAAALVALTPDLSALAQVEPDADFAADVVARTRALLARRVPWGLRVRAAWGRLLLRPRLAWEFATAGCFLLILLCGMPFSPLRQAPRQALAAIQVFPTDVIERSDQTLRSFWTQYAPRTWDATGGRVARRSREIAREFEAEHAQAASAWRSLGLDMDELGAAVRSRNFAQASHAMHAIQIDLTALWNGLRTPADHGGEGGPPSVSSGDDPGSERKSEEP